MDKQGVMVSHAAEDGRLRYLPESEIICVKQFD